MPHITKPFVLDRIARKHAGRDGIRRVADDMGISFDVLRNAIHGTDPMGMGRIYALARALDIPEDDVHLLIATEPGSVPDGTPNRPPEPRKVPKPDPQRKEKAGKSPRRATDRWAS